MKNPILILSLVPHIQPNFLDDTFIKILKNQGDFPQLGGMRGKSFRGFIPTLETALFILSGNDLKKRFEIIKIFMGDHLFSEKNVISIDNANSGEPFSSGCLVLESDYVDQFTLGLSIKPRFGADFPAERITTAMEWEDLVLSESVMRQIKELEVWIEHNDKLLYEWGMLKRIGPGYRVLFHGPPGTGKTLTAMLLGKYTNRDVYRVDLSLVVSKFIGRQKKT